MLTPFSRTFIGQVPLCVIGFVAVAFALPGPGKAACRGWRRKLRRVDFAGAAVLVGAVLTLLLGLDRGAREAWLQTPTLTLIGASLLLFALFVGVEAIFAREPVAPRRILFHPALLAVFAANFFQFGAYLAVLFYLPLFFQAAERLSAATSGLLLMPGIAGTVAGSLGAGFAMRASGRYRTLTLLSHVLLLLGTVPILLGTGLVWRSGVATSVGLALCGLGNGAALTATLTALLAQVGAADQALATACAYLSRNLGCIVGLSVASSVVQQRLQNRLSHWVDPERAEGFLRKVRESLDYMDTLDPKEAWLVRGSYEDAIRWGWILCIGAFAVALAAALLIEEKPLERKEEGEADG